MTRNYDNNTMNICYKCKPWNLEIALEEEMFSNLKNTNARGMGGMREMGMMSGLCKNACMYYSMNVALFTCSSCQPSSFY